MLVDDAPDRSGGVAELVAAAGTVTAATVSFLVRHGSGVLHVALPEAECERLRLPAPAHPQRGDGARLQRVSVDAAAGVSTGISAADRAHTARLLADEDTTADDLARPGTSSRSASAHPGPARRPPQQGCAVSPAPHLRR